jgi:ankyrin repeat protein
MAKTKEIPPPPPYAVEDPNRSNPALLALRSQYVSVFSACTPPAELNGHATPFERPQIPRYLPPIAASPAPIRPRSSSDLEKTGFVSAIPYFELRSQGYERPIDTLYHRVVIGPDTRPDDLPYPQPIDKWLGRRVDSQDWDTFLNHLFPQHSIENHSQISYKELKSETMLRSVDASPLLEDYQRSESASLMDPSYAHAETNYLRELRLSTVTAEWNEGFFGPRGLKVNIDLTGSRVTPKSPISPGRRASATVLRKSPPPVKPQETLLHQAVTKLSKSKLKEALENDGENLETPNLKGETPLYRLVYRGDKSMVQLLLERGANPAARPPRCNTPLHITVNRNRKSILKMLIERSTREEIDEVTSSGETALYLAVQKRHISCVELLLNAGANPESRPAGKESMLNLAVSAAQCSIVKLLLEKGSHLEEPNKDGNTPLCTAVSKGATKVVNLLLEHGASVVARNGKGESPLSVAVHRGDTSTVTRLLAHKGIDLESENAKGETPFYTSIVRGDSSIAKLLLDKGANPSAHPPNSETALNLVVSKGNTTLTHLLLESGVDVEIPNHSGESPLFKAVSKGDSSITSLLVGKGASADTKNKSGEPALYKAVYKGDTSITSLLLCHGANPETPNPNGETNLYRAVYRGDTSIVSLLLCNGANTETPNSKGETPLYRAVYRNDASIVSLLLGRGANPDTVSASGETAMQYAMKKGNKTVIHLMSSYAKRKGG